MVYSILVSSISHLFILNITSTYCKPSVYHHYRVSSFLGSVDLYGTTYLENMLATGFGMHMAVPLLRKNWRPDMEEADARKLLEDCMRVLYYRDARTINKVSFLKQDFQVLTLDSFFLVSLLTSSHNLLGLISLIFH